MSYENIPGNGSKSKEITFVVFVDQEAKESNEIINSIENQTSKNFELILVSNLLDVVAFEKNLFSKTKHTKLLLDNELSIQKLYNEAINIASGEYIHFLKGPYCIDQNLLEIISQIIITENPDFVSLTSNYFNERTKVLEKKYYIENNLSNNYPREFNPNQIPEIFYQTSTRNIHEKIFNINFLKKNNIRFLNDCIDFETVFCFEAQTLAKSIFYYDQPLITVKDRFFNCKKFFRMEDDIFLNTLSTIYKFVSGKRLRKKLKISLNKFILEYYLDYLQGFRYSKKENIRILLELSTQLFMNLIRQYGISEKEFLMFVKKPSLKVFLNSKHKLLIKNSKIIEPAFFKKQSRSKKIKYPAKLPNKLVKISIIIPTYMDRGIERVVSSIYEQKGLGRFFSVEIIICFNGNNYNYLEFLQMKFGNLKNLVLIQSKINGEGAREDGIEVCTGDWVFFYDDDDLISEGFILGLLSYSSYSNIIIGEYYYLYEEENLSKQTKTVKHQNPYEEICEGCVVKKEDFGFYDFFGTIHGRIIKKELLDTFDVFPYKKGYYLDTLYNYENFDKISSLFRINKNNEYYYRTQTKNSLMRMQNISNKTSSKDIRKIYDSQIYSRVRFLSELKQL